VTGHPARKFYGARPPAQRQLWFLADYSHVTIVTFDEPGFCSGQHHSAVSDANCYIMLVTFPMLLSANQREPRKETFRFDEIVRRAHFVIDEYCWNVVL
jgi:hypothetical protein